MKRLTKKRGARALPLTLIRSFKNPLISAASGLVFVDGRFYIVADDELSLYSYPQTRLGAARAIKLIPGRLPRAKKARKERKPDWEALVVDPVTSDILCIPSGSKKNRCRGVVVSKAGGVRTVNFKKLYQALSQKFSELNIEGAVWVGERLWLFQRGNGKKIQNATIEILAKSILEKNPIIRKIRRYDLECLNDVPFSFTDAATDESGIWFLAVAENTNDPVLDGEVLGSVLGRMDWEGNILSTHALDLRSKPEGLCVSGKHFYLVTDDDDRKIPARLYRGKLPR